MLDTLGVVYVTSSDEGQPSQLSRQIAGKSLVHQTARRVTESMQLDGVIIVLGENPADAAAAQSMPLDIPVHVSEAADTLGRIIDALTVYPAKGVVLVSANTPLVDPVLIDRLVRHAGQNPDRDYIGFGRQDGRACGTSGLGLLAEWCSAKALRRAHQEASAASDRQHASQYIYTRPEAFRVEMIDVPARLDRDDLRLRVDREEDWDLVREIIEAVDIEDCDWQRIAGLLDGQPALRKQMARLNETVGVDG
ncbi:MAG: NTP transferase domain-containing protein [Pirellulales bacterium]|nr:NTP transferase domain-containing protein [Pirellulales bacterium]